MIEILNGTRETVKFRSSTLTRFYRNDEPTDYPPHWHLPGEIIAPLSGGYQVTVDGKALDLAPGDILVIASSELHSIKAPPTGVRYILNFDSTPFDQLPDLAFLLSMMQPYGLFTAAECPHLTGQLMDILRQIEEEYSGNVPLFHDGEICALLLHFFVLAGRHIAHIDKFQGLTFPKQQEYADRFIYICDYINNHCTENISLDEIAEQAGFSKYHFSRLFREVIGTTCHNYLINRRILYAQKLLADLSVSITDVSMRSGFNSLSTFNRIFKKSMGCTPSEYRQLNSGVQRQNQG